jgi:hypothetical protein
MPYYAKNDCSRPPTRGAFTDNSIKLGLIEIGLISTTLKEEGKVNLSSMCLDFCFKGPFFKTLGFDL